MFISYSHHDEALKAALHIHLSPLVRTGVIRTWHDRVISPGSEWRGEIDVYLNEADIILLLLSADFVASDYCHDVEMARVLERHESGEAVVIPIIGRPFDFTNMPIAKLQALPTGAKAITEWSNSDAALKDDVESLRRVIDSLALRRIATHQRETGQNRLTQIRVLDACIAEEIPREAISRRHRNDPFGAVGGVKVCAGARC